MSAEKAARIVEPVLIAAKGRHMLRTSTKVPLPGAFLRPCGCAEYADGGGIEWPCEAHR